MRRDGESKDFHAQDQRRITFTPHGRAELSTDCRQPTHRLRSGGWVSTPSPEGRAHLALTGGNERRGTGTPLVWCAEGCRAINAECTRICHDSPGVAA